MKREGFAKDLVPEVGAEGSWRPEVDGAAQKRRKLFFHPDELEEARSTLRLELDEDVDVALLSKIRPQDGPEEREPPNMVTPAEILDLRTGRLRRRDSGIPGRHDHPLILPPATGPEGRVPASGTATVPPPSITP